MNLKITKLFIASLILLSFMSFIQAEKWFLLESKQYGYKIEFPKKPTEKPQVVNSEIGELKMNIFIHDASKDGKDDNLIYMVNYTEYPDTLIHSDKTEILSDFFRNSIDGAVRNVHGKLLSEKVIQIGEYPGREIKIDFRDGMAVIRMRIYLVKNQMYLLQTITETKKDFNKSITRFMDSFELIGTGVNKR
ncbi:MAG: hypothetical protein ACK4ND_15425 [Cytophagaceae bacterium]